MSTASKAPPITVDQYQGFEGFPGLRDELIYGEIVMSPQPKALHQQVSKNILLLLDQRLKGTAYSAQMDSNIKFSSIHSMPAPDVFVVLRERWREACETGQYLDSPPLLAVEVLSSANRESSVQKKIDIYLSSSVTAAWVVYPKKKIIRAHFDAGVDRRTVDYEDGTSIPLPTPIEGSVNISDFFRID